MNKKALAILATAGALATSATAADFTTAYEEPDFRDGVKIGVLSCDIGSGFGYILGSAKSADCVFSPTRGRPDHYTGVIRKLGVDLGYTARGRLVWAVFAPTAGYHQGSLGGIYKGASVEATLGAGVGANLLVGGTSGSVHLQPLSVTGQLGLNASATGTSVTLTPQG